MVCTCMIQGVAELKAEDGVIDICGVRDVGR
jgi:hypothetical protein